MNRKIIFIFVIIILIGIGGHFLLFGKSEQTAQQPLPTQTSQSISEPPSNIAQTPVSEIETANWNTLTNQFGWTIRYPSTWEAYGMHDNTAEEEEGSIIQGPINCFEGGLRCGTIQVDSRSGRTTAEFSSMTPKQFLLDYQLKYDQARKLLAQRELIVGGEPAHEITFLQTNAGGYPNGQIAKEIAINHKGVIYDLWYYEDFKDRTAIKSMDDWKLTALFEQIISTFKFSN